MKLGEISHVTIIFQGKGDFFCIKKKIKGIWVVALCQQGAKTLGEEFPCCMFRYLGTLVLTSLDIITWLSHIYLFWWRGNGPSLCRSACGRRDQWHGCITPHRRSHQRCLWEELGPADGFCLDTGGLPTQGCAGKGNWWGWWWLLEYEGLDVADDCSQLVEG